MTPAAKVTYLSALLIGLSLGLLLGYRQTMNNLKLYGETRFEMPPLALQDFSREQYAHADYEHARAALLTYAGLLEEMEKAKTEKSVIVEMRDTYTRLALLEDAVNNPEQSHAYMTKARYWNSAGGGRNYSESEESEMKAAFKRFAALR
jgi:hypothetical protein